MDEINSLPPQETAGHAAVARLSKPVIFALGGLVILGLGAFLYSAHPASQAPAQPKTIKIGILQNVKHLDDVVTGFKQGMTNLGYVDGQNVSYEYVNVNGDTNLAAETAKHFADENVDLILAITPPVIKIARQQVEQSGKNIPIVFTNANGLVESGFFPGYQSTGKNMTGLVPDDIPVTLKKLEFMKQIQPNAKKVAVFFGTGPGTEPAQQAMVALRKKAPELRLTLVEYPIPGNASDSPTVLNKLAAAVKPGDFDAIITVPDPVSNYGDNPLTLIALSKRVKAPVYFLTTTRVFDGGLLSYSQDATDSGRQAAAMAYKILNGTRADDIPLQVSSKNILIINLKTAAEMDLTVPQDLTFVADQIIPATSSATSTMK